MLNQNNILKHPSVYAAWIALWHKWRPRLVNESDNLALGQYCSNVAYRYWRIFGKQE